MKQFFIGLTTLFVSINATAHHVCHISPGSLFCGRGKIDKVPLGSYGSVHLNRTQITGKLDTNSGSFIANASTLNDLNLRAGAVSFSKTRINGSVNIMAGAIILDNNSVIKNNAELYSPDVRIVHSHTGAIKIISRDQNKTLYLRLSDNSVVKGDVTFSNNNGKICLAGNSSILGHVNGGKVIKGDC